MAISSWRRIPLLLATSSMLALAACATDPITDSIIKDPKLPPEQQDVASAERLMRLGDSARASGDPRTSIGFYRRAFALEPENYPVLIRLAGALNQVDAYHEAAEIYRRALQTAPRDPEALRGLGNSLLAMNQPILAREEYQTALEVSHDPRLYGAIGISFDVTGDHAIAQDYFRQGLEASPGNMALMNNLALSLMLSGDHGEAVDLLRMLASDRLATARHRQNLALAYALAGQSDAAERLLTMEHGPVVGQQTLAYYETLRGRDDLARLLLAPSKMRFAAEAKEPAAPPPQNATTAAPAPADTALESAPLPAPEIDPAEREAAQTPAALPPVGPMQLDAPLKSWNSDAAIEAFEEQRTGETQDVTADTPETPTDDTGTVDLTVEVSDEDLRQRLAMAAAGP